MMYALLVNTDTRQVLRKRKRSILHIPRPADSKGQGWDLESMVLISALGM